MTTRARTLDQKLGDFDRAFQVIRQSIVPEAARTFVREMAGVQGVAELRSYGQLQHVVSAGDRAAAIAAAMIVASPIKALPSEVYEEEGDDVEPA